MTRLIISILLLFFLCMVSTAYAQTSAGTDSIVYTTVEEVPQFPGGPEELKRFIITNIKYPDTAAKDSTTGKVYIKFIIEKDGKVNEIKVIRGVRQDLDTEALRVVRLMPSWKPGILRGSPVRTFQILPLNFSIPR